MDVYNTLNTFLNLQLWVIMNMILKFLSKVSNQKKFDWKKILKINNSRIINNKRIIILIFISMINYLKIKLHN